ncbi:hypothetical protein [Rhodobium gokarnense]|uniref:Sulfotransferase domain-containing protein n=1 Tax=Rhodobium gokarnense TaxID=364296 RepID=A0ABT3HGG9_9HYPH|nr:hypothetical protein [Rhodobium gokarnense]MCW2309495.1 hypothetical protein [Rhodobium gokarnense]
MTADITAAGGGVGRIPAGRRAILHIGLHKTGTTYLQRCLFENIEALEDLGFFCPSPSGSRVVAAHNLAREVRKTRQFEPNGMLWDHVLPAFAASNATTLLLTSECFDLSLPRHIARFRELLDGMEVTVLLCLRHPIDLIQSMYSQITKSERDDDFAAFVEHRVTKDNRLRFDRLHRQWSKTFGAENVRVLFYEEIRDTLLEVFLREIGAEALLANGAPRLPDAKVINASADERLIALRVACAARAKATGMDPARYRDEIEPALLRLATRRGWTDSRLKLVTPALAARIAEACRPEIEALHERIPVPASYFTFTANRDAATSPEDALIDGLADALLTGDLTVAGGSRPSFLSRLFGRG